MEVTYRAWTEETLEDAREMEEVGRVFVHFHCSY